MKKRQLGFKIAILMILLIIPVGAVFAMNSDEEVVDAGKKIVNDETNQEVIAGLEIITDQDELNEVIEDNPKVAEYLEQNEVFGELEIITDLEVIQQITDENPELAYACALYTFAYIKGDEVCLRNTHDLEGTINGKLSESNKDWVVLNDNYSVDEGYLWWEVVDSSIGSSGVGCK